MQRTEDRVKLFALIVGVPSLISACWIRFAPHNFYENFPGFGHHWVRALGPYDGHTITDYGAAFLGLSVGLIAIGMMPRARAIPILLTSWVVASIPHLAYHVVATGPLSTGDNIANIGVLALMTVVPAVALVLDHRAHKAPHPKAAGRSENARIPLAPEKGLLNRMSYRASRKEVGVVTTPVAVHAHHPVILAGYGAFEYATMNAKRVKPRLKELAVLRAAMIVGCEYCVDIGSAIGREVGLTENELRDMVAWRDSPRFSDADKAVIEYAEAMTRTPAEIPDELFDRVRALFDDDSQMVELTAAIAIENYRARFNWAFGIGSDGFSDGAYCVPPDREFAAAT